MHRRAFLGTAIGVALAGCLGGGDGSDGGPGPNAPPEELLPEPPAEWTLNSSGSLLPPGDAETGHYGAYTGPDGATYRIEVIRWPSEADAGTYSYAESSLNWTHEATVGRFFFACRLDTDTDANGCVELLTASSAVEETDVETL